MVTIEHGIGHVAVYNGKPEDVFYNAGILPADYPMPAIPLRVSHGSWFTMVHDAIHITIYLFVGRGGKLYFKGTRDRHTCYLH